VNRHLLHITLTLLFLLLLTQPAHAYIDPVSGSMALQLLVAAVAGALVTLKIYWQKIRNLFGAGKPAKQEESEEESAEN
jgi:hypothetical protein